MKGIVVDRFYFSKIWRRERNILRKGIKEWFVNRLSSKERRTLIRMFWKKGLNFGLFPWDVNNYIRNQFGISLFEVRRYWGVISVLTLPTWALRKALELRRKGIERVGKISYTIYEEYGFWAEPKLLWKFFNLMDPAEVLRFKKRYDTTLLESLHKVGRVEQDFILAIEENKDQNVYEKFAREFGKIPLESLFFYVCNCQHIPALIDAVLIDKVAECAGLEPPELWKRFKEVVFDVR